MSNSRETILGRVKSALAPIERRATLPDWSVELAQAKKLVGQRPSDEVFAERIKLVNGRCFNSAAEIVAQLRDNDYKHGYCDPEIAWMFEGLAKGAGITIETTFDRTRVDDYAFGITRAYGAVAESGSIILNDALTSRRLGALTPWVHIAIVKRDTIIPFLVDALGALPKDPNIILVTGPSKTADVEGILIEGVHGPGQQWAMLA